MKILPLQYTTVVLDQKQLSTLKGGTNQSDAKDIIVITDDDVI
ncbi:MAG: hypothetical protein AAFW73_11700 [Bacteroidota bacterium]